MIKGIQTYNFEGSNFDSRRGSKADVSQATTDNSYASLKTVIDYIHTGKPFYLLCWFCL